MACFSLGWIEQILISAAVIAGIYMIVMLLASKVPLGEPFVTAVQVLKIIIWVAATIWVIVFLFNLVACAFGGSPLMLPYPHR